MKTKTVPEKTIAIPSEYFTAASCGAALLHNDKVGNYEDLEWYFNDLYQLFLYQFARLVHEPSISLSDEEKMQSMIVELAKVKRMLGGESIQA